MHATDQTSAPFCTFLLCFYNNFPVNVQFLKQRTAYYPCLRCFRVACNIYLIFHSHVSMLLQCQFFLKSHLCPTRCLQQGSLSLWGHSLLNWLFMKTTVNMLIWNTQSHCGLSWTQLLLLSFTILPHQCPPLEDNEKALLQTHLLKTQQFKEFTFIDVLSLGNSPSYMSHVGDCIHQDVAFVLLIEYLTFPLTWRSL